MAVSSETVIRITDKGIERSCENKFKCWHISFFFPFLLFFFRLLTHQIFFIWCRDQDNERAYFDSADWVLGKVILIRSLIIARCANTKFFVNSSVFIHPKKLVVVQNSKEQTWARWQELLWSPWDLSCRYMQIFSPFATILFQYLVHIIDILA